MELFILQTKDATATSQREGLLIPTVLNMAPDQHHTDGYLYITKVWHIVHLTNKQVIKQKNSLTSLAD